MRRVFTTKGTNRYLSARKTRNTTILFVGFVTFSVQLSRISWLKGSLRSADTAGVSVTPSMRLSGLILGAILLILPGAGAAAAGRVHGVVADESGGVLPGVTVVAIAADGTF